jgi:hypothetical protein
LDGLNADVLRELEAYALKDASGKRAKKKKKIGTILRVVACF